MSVSTPADEFEVEAREYARKHASTGLACFAQAFNHCDESYHPHRYAPEVQERFKELATELIALVESGRIDRNPKYREHLLAQEAKQDKTLQSVLKQATRKTGIRRTGTRRTRD